MLNKYLYTMYIQHEYIVQMNIRFVKLSFVILSKYIIQNRKISRLLLVIEQNASDKYQ